MRPDYTRDVCCVLGLPFDKLTLNATESRLRSAVASRERCFLSTPNLNFAIACAGDEAFRLSVLQSDLSVADGWPIVAIARMLGAGVPERVAGSTLFETLMESSERPPIKVYFFGGPPGVAESANANLNARRGGAIGVGFQDPGFGSVEEMSATATIQRINASAPDMLVVALGAKKGQAWIQRCLPKLTAPVVSHLGAVVNFVAGTVVRAPRWAQALRLEWLWRIKEEPTLWRRYADDGVALLKVAGTQAVLAAFDQWMARRQARSGNVSATTNTSADGTTLRLSGTWGAEHLAQLRPHLEACSEAGLPLNLDLREAGRLDTTVIGSLLLLYGWQRQEGLPWRIVQASALSTRSLRWAGAGYLLDAR